MMPSKEEMSNQDLLERHRLISGMIKHIQERMVTGQNLNVTGVPPSNTVVMSQMCDESMNNRSMNKYSERVYDHYLKSRTQIKDKGVQRTSDMARAALLQGDVGEKKLLKSQPAIGKNVPNFKQ